jgi:hypothetical protein
MTRRSPGFLALCLIAATFVFAQEKPEVRVSASRVKSGGSVQISGTGFTPNHSIMSHLLRPDGTEYNPLRLRTNERGEFFHKVDTTMLEIGTFELWIEDEASKTLSNRVHFTVEEQPRSTRISRMKTGPIRGLIR